MSPDARRTIHAALDQILDTITKEQGKPAERVPRRRVRPLPPAPDPETERHVLSVLERAGFQK
jgi:hypothetical protein